MTIVEILILLLSLFGYQVVETAPVSCEVHGVYIDQREDILYASVVDSGEEQTYVWSIDTFSLAQPTLEEVLPFTEDLEFTDVDIYPYLDVFQAVADDDEVIFIILDMQTGEATRHDLGVCQRG